MNKFIFSVILFLYICFSGHVNAQENRETKINWGLRYSFVYNPIFVNKSLDISHHNINLSLDINRSNFYIGPQYSLLFINISDTAAYVYDKNIFGLNFGYSYRFLELNEKISFFGRLDFSLYTVKHTSFHRGPPFETNKQSFIVENTFAFGGEYKLNKHFNLSAGIGFGSYDGFFLILSSFTPTAFAGLEYKF